jgi:hypothetical protein
VSEQPQWEIVHIRKRNGVPVEQTARFRVPGGWLYRCVRFDIGEPDVMAMVFVPDAEVQP